MTAPLPYLIAGFIAAAFTALLCRFGPRLAARLSLIDHPGGRKLHARSTPLMGGLAILFVIAPLTAATAVLWPDLVGLPALVIIGSTAIIAAIGTLDDRNHIDPVKRLAVTVAVFTATVLAGQDYAVTYINWNGLPPAFGLGPFAAVGTVLCLTTLINGVNLADGKNGLVLGMLLGWLVFLAVSGPAAILVPVAVALGSVGVLLIFNLNDRLFLGDGGSYGFAALVGHLSIYSFQKSTVLVSSDQVGLMFMIPVGDMIRLMVVRWRRGVSPFTPDRDHLHHLLLDRLGWRRGLLLYLALVLLPTALALVYPPATLTIIALTFLSYWVIVISAHRAGARAERLARGNAVRSA